MQVYVTFCDHNYNFLVVKKRQLNRWWGGQIGAQNSLVNQAGQWAFPGGRCECNSGDDHSADAKREFEEETGLDFPPARLIRIHKQQAYQLYVYQANDVTKMAHDIRNFTAPSKVAVDRPNNPKIKDWELADAELVPQIMLHTYLGKKETNISAEAKVRIDRLSPRSYSQSIDWYAEMATALQTANLSTSSKL